MDLTKNQLEILSKVQDNPGQITMCDLTNDGLSLDDIPRFAEELRSLFQEKLLEPDGASYRLTSLGRKIYETNRI